MDDKFDLTPLKRKKKTNSKRKGNKYENDVCKLLNQHFNTKDFCRTPGSGAYATTHHIPDYLKIYGDLITPQGFRYVIDTKKGYNDLDFFSMINQNSTLWDFIEQCERDSKASKKDFLLIYKQDNKAALAIVKKENINTKEKYLLFSSQTSLTYGVQTLLDFLKQDIKLFYI